MTTSPTPSLFPGAPTASDAAGHTGIARLAASSPCARTKSDTEYFLLPVRSILNRCDSGRVPFAWTVNPYRGCEFGCHYCYARYTHEFMDLSGADFEKKIFVKQDAAALFARDLDQHASSLIPGPCSPVPESIAIGTATDPYQPAEREFRVTRGLLERLAVRSGISLSITTKSNLITRDLDLLCRIAAQNDLSINITVTTLRPRLARLLEPRAPRPDLRLAALRTLRDAGLAAGVFAMPVLPGVTDREADLDKLFLASRKAGAQWLGAQVLFLRSSSLTEFLSLLEGKSPKLARQYRKWYGRTGYAPEKVRAEITARVRALRQKHGLASRPYAPDRLARSADVLPPQLSLPLAV